MATYSKRGHKAPKPKTEKDTLKDFSDKNSTTAEVFNTLDRGANKIEAWVIKNQKIIYGIVAVVILIIGIFFANQKFLIEPKQEQAVNNIYQAQQYFSQAINAETTKDSLYNLALNGDNEKMGFLKIIENYKGTDAANLSHYYAGISYLNLHKYKEAIAYLEKFKSDDEFLKPLATGAIGDAFAQNKQLEEALEYYEKAFSVKTNELTTPRFLFKAGLVALELGKKETAHRYFLRIQNEFNSSQDAQNIDEYIVLSK